MSWNWARVLNRTVTSISEEYYEVTLEMAAAVGGLEAGGGLTSEGLTVPQPPIVSTTPQSCVGGNGLTYNYTSAGTRTGLGGIGIAPYQSYSTDFLGYWSLGIGGGSGNVYPTVGTQGSWGDGGVNNCAFTSGGVDYTSGGNFQRLTITVVGPGTLSILTAQHPTGACGPTTNMTAECFGSHSGVLESSDTKAPGTPLTIAIADAHCSHYVILSGDHAWGFVSATWTP